MSLVSGHNPLHAISLQLLAGDPKIMGNQNPVSSRLPRDGLVWS